MPVITIRNLPEEVHRVLELRAARHGHSTEVEIQEILEETVRSRPRLKLGSELAAFRQHIGNLDLDITRDRTPTEPATFE